PTSGNHRHPNSRVIAWLPVMTCSIASCTRATGLPKPSPNCSVINLKAPVDSLRLQLHPAVTQTGNLFQAGDLFELD
ncbi:MAG: hypothetical protein KUG81_05115, partial [Gammaproteobacteria bacterium]|nr:hypothetical protein [Gammaproteobacteria bacterium]